jgi:hypothetical protein
MRAAIAFALLVGCSSRTEAPPRPLEWRVVSELDRVALTVHVAGERDVWIGGGGLTTGAGALLLHGDGEHFTEIATGRSETIWWVGGTDDLWAVGERGLILRRDGDRFVTVNSGTTATLYGVWGSGRDDAWAVGGGTNSGVLLHWDGAAWSAVDTEASGTTYFKVWGRARDDVFVVGVGVALHFDGTKWSTLSVPTKTSLFTVHGGSAGVFAVGGGPPTLLRVADPSCTEVPLPDTANGILSGVSVAPDGTTYVVGERKQRYRITGSTILDDTSTLELSGIDLHAVAAFGDGAIAVGGNYMSLMRPGATARGAILRFSR